MNDKDVFEQGADIVDKAIGSSKNFLKQFLNWVLFIALVIVTTLLTFTALGIVNRITDDVLVNALFMFVVGTVAFLVFFPQGENNERRLNDSYGSNLRLWGAKSDCVRKCGKLAAFGVYCKEETKELWENIRDNYILNAGIDINTYNLQYQDKSIKQIQKDKTLSNQQKKNLIKAKKEIKVRPISPVAILAGAELAPGKSVGQKRIGTKAKIMSSRIVGSILMTAAFAIIAIMPADNIGWAAIGIYALRLLNLFVSAVSGFYGGVGKIKADNVENKAKILFINKFLEKEGIKE